MLIHITNSKVRYTHYTIEQININANIHISQKIDIYTSIKITHEDFKPAH